MFLVAMMVAMVVEAAPLPAQAGARRGGPRHERLPIAHVPVDAVVGRPLDRGGAGHGRLLLRRLAAQRLSPSMGLLELLRLALVALVAVLLNQPEWIEEFRPEEKPTIAVLWDASASMDTRDVVARRRSRRRRPIDPARGDRAAGRPDSTWDKLRERMNVVIQPFSEPQAGPRHRPVRAARPAPADGSRTCAAIVLASDGDWNEGQPPVQAAARLRMQGRAGLRRAGGQPHAAARRRAPEPRPADLRRRRQVGARSRSRSRARCRASSRTTVTLRTSDGDEVTKEVRIAADEPHQRLAGLEAEGDRRLHADAVGPQARRRDARPTTTS